MTGRVDQRVLPSAESSRKNLNDPPKAVSPTAAQAIVDALIAEGVTHVFGITGDTVLPILDALYHRADEIRYITCKHEMSAAAMADGYSRATGNVGCCIFHVGPSVANAVLGTWSANKDAVPLLVLSANLDRFRLRRNIWHEFDVNGVFSKFTKWSEQLVEAKDARRLMRNALQTAKSGMPGAVHLDFPKDLLVQPVDVETSDLSLKGGAHMGAAENRCRPTQSAVDAALDLLCNSKRPVIIAGRGLAWSQAEAELLELAESLVIPVVTTEMGRGSIPETHPLSGGLMGHFGLTTPNSLVEEADVVLGLGCQFHNVNTINWQLISRDAMIIQVEMDPAELGRQYAVGLGIHADCGEFLRDLLDEVRRHGRTRAVDRAQLVADIAQRKTTERARFYGTDLAATPIKPQLVIQTLEELRSQDSIIVAGSGHLTHFANYLQIVKPRHFHYSIGSGTMAWAFAAALGMKTVCPTKQIIVPIGDGDFGMNAQELETSVREKLPVTVVVFNDVSYGALRIFQKMHYGERYIGSHYGETDWVKLAEAYGARGIRVDTPADLKPALSRALASDVTTVVDVRIDPWELAHRSSEFKRFHQF